MTRQRATTSALALSLALGLALPALAQNGHGGGHGNGNGGGHGNGRGQDARADQGGGPDRGDRGPGNGHDRRGGPDRSAPVVVLANGPDRRVERQIQGQVRDIERQAQRQVVTDHAPVVILQRRADRGLLNGCPPGLAKKDNGCLPPGQVREVARESIGRYDYLWRTTANDADRYRYENGYVYRLNPQGGLLGYLPVLGGVLSPGNAWPTQYAYDPAPAYYTQYYGLNDRYQYRYADGVMYGVDPQTQAIGQVAALLTGQPINVGQRMPAGYDVYNVPYAYRSQYPDGANSLYRYNDGRIYQVDPTTQLVQSVIQLLT